MNSNQDSGPTINNSIMRKMLFLVVSVSILGISSLGHFQHPTRRQPCGECPL